MGATVQSIGRIRCLFLQVAGQSIWTPHARALLETPQHALRYDHSLSRVQAINFGTRPGAPEGIVNSSMSDKNFLL
jgi:hypothetical protein